MGRPKLLTVDDEVDFVDMIKNYFSLRGYDCFTAIRGDAALDLIEKEKPDVVLIDLKLPGMDGDQLFKRMLKIHPQGKAIMITAFKDEGQIEKKLLSMGIFAYFEKPIASMKELEAAVREATNSARGGKNG